MAGERTVSSGGWEKGGGGAACLNQTRPVQVFQPILKLGFVSTHCSRLPKKRHLFPRKHKESRQGQLLHLNELCWRLSGTLRQTLDCL